MNFYEYIQLRLTPMSKTEFNLFLANRDKENLEYSNSDLEKKLKKADEQLEEHYFLLRKIRGILAWNCLKIDEEKQKDLVDNVDTLIKEISECVKKYDHGKFRF